MLNYTNKNKFEDHIEILKKFDYTRPQWFMKEYTILVLQLKHLTT
jgi:hypothetical protein